VNNLGINFFGHDSAAALVIDGKLASAAEEERFTRVKHDSSFPSNSIKFCLDYSNLSINDIDAVAFSVDPVAWIHGDFLSYTLSCFPDSIPLLQSKLDLVPKFVNYEVTIRDELQYNGSVHFFNHHTCHFASSYYVSNFDKAALLSMDGSGEYETALLGVAEKNSLTSLQQVNLPYSIGYLYDAISVYLGFNNKTGAGKVMGLAPYGNSTTFIDEFRKIVLLDEDTGTFTFDLSYLEYHKRRDVWISDKFIETFGPRKIDENESFSQDQLDVAAALQMRIEEVGLNAANYLYRKTQSENLCMAGGVALNCVMNGRILRETPFKNIFVQPAAGDSGTAIGAALLHYYRENPTNTKYVLPNTYLGPEYSDEKIVEQFNKYSIDYHQAEDVERQTAKLMAEGNIIGWFQGRMEFGPRALGNRSILTAPGPAEIKDILNKKVKHREPFRPFAPAVLYEDVLSYFDSDHESPYMLLVYNVLEDKINDISATVHVDNTCRVQTVTKEQNRKYYGLISEIKKITNIPVVLNTSFNVRGEPLVCTPEDAIKCFLGTAIDTLVIGNYMVHKKSQRFVNKV